MLPTYQQAADECRDNDKASALAWFITEQEPSGIVEEAKFRRELEAVIKEAEIAAALRQQAFCEGKYAMEKDDEKNARLCEQIKVDFRNDKAAAILFFSGFFTGTGVVSVIYIINRFF